MLTHRQVGLTLGKKVGIELVFRSVLERGTISVQMANAPEHCNRGECRVNVKDDKTEVGEVSILTPIRYTKIESGLQD